jgi:hypothetical protein
VTEIDFTPGDFPDPMLFTVLATRHWLAGTEAQLDSLLLLLSTLLGRRRRAHVRSRALGNAKRAIENVRRQLGEAADEMDRGLRRTPDLSVGYYGSRPVEPALMKEGDTVMSILRDARERMAAVHIELDLFLVQLLVLGRTRRKVGRRRLAQAKRAVRAARQELAEGQAEVERVFAVEPYPDAGADLARETS